MNINFKTVIKWIANKINMHRCAYCNNIIQHTIICTDCRNYIEIIKEYCIYCGEYDQGRDCYCKGLHKFIDNIIYVCNSKANHIYSQIPKLPYVSNLFAELINQKLEAFYLNANKHSVFITYPESYSEFNLNKMCIIYLITSKHIKEKYHCKYFRINKKLYYYKFDLINKRAHEYTALIIRNIKMYDKNIMEQCLKQVGKIQSFDVISLT